MAHCASYHVDNCTSDPREFGAYQYLYPHPCLARVYPPKRTQKRRKRWRNGQDTLNFDDFYEIDYILVNSPPKIMLLGFFRMSWVGECVPVFVPAGTLTRDPCRYGQPVHFSNDHTMHTIVKADVLLYVTR
jgi:hypothetical protein